MGGDELPHHSRRKCRKNGDDTSRVNRRKSSRYLIINGVKYTDPRSAAEALGRVHTTINRGVLSKDVKWSSYEHIPKD
ncbi:hypothetical protein VPHD148_0234 [Vibrio phage D148]